MADPALDYKAISGSYSPNGSTEILESWSPNSDELWYVDEIRVHVTNVSGDGYSNRFGISIYRGEGVSNPPNINIIGQNETYGQVELEPRTNNVINRIQVEEFISDSEKLAFADINGKDRDFTMSYVIQIRRVL